MPRAIEDGAQSAMFDTIVRKSILKVHFRRLRKIPCQGFLVSCSFSWCLMVFSSASLFQSMERTLLSMNAIVMASSDQVSSKLGDEVVILNLRNGVYYGLDPVGARIWDLIQEPRSVQEVCAVLLEEYEVTPEQCASDVLALLRDLEAQGLIEVRAV